MPILLIYGVDKFEQTERFIMALNKRIVDLRELNLNEDDITVKFVRSTGSYGEIIIFVEGLFDKPERTPEVRKQLAERLVETTKRFCPDATLIECLIRPFEPTLGFASIRISQP